MDTALHNIYFKLSNPASFSGISALYKEARKRIPHIRLADVAKFLQKQKTYRLHKTAPRKFKRRKVTAAFLDSHWQIDLMDMQKLSKHNEGYKFILTCVDILSKYAWAVPIRNKKPGTVRDAFAKILQGGRKCLWVYSDMGKEFLGKEFQAFLNKKAIVHQVATSDVKACNVERLNRTLKNKLWRYFTEKRTFRYINILQTLLHSLNHTYKENIGCAPAEVTKDNEKVIRKRLFGTKNRFKKQDLKFKEGDKVRISKYKTIFDKGYLPNYTEEVFTVSKVERGEPPIYMLKDQNGEDIEGIFYNEELISDD